MKKYLLKTWGEIKSGQNADVYLTIVVCFALLIIDIFISDLQEAISSATLATLLLIAINLLNSRQVTNELQQAIKEVNLSRTSMSFFHEWGDIGLHQQIGTAKDISVMAVSPYEFVNYNAETLKLLVKQGVTIRFVMTDPNGTAINMTSLIFHGAAKQKEYITNQVRMTLQKIHEIAVESAQSNVQVKLIDNIPPAVMTMINRQNNNGAIFVTLNGVDTPTSSRPSFCLSRDSDGRWYDFYQSSFENLWNSVEAKEYNLN